jgi:arylsulfatase A-like enzyme
MRVLLVVSVVNQNTFKINYFYCQRIINDLLMKIYLPILILLTALLIQVSCSEKPVEKPNFLFIFADDHSHRAVGYSGNSVVQTPNIDELASEGISFNNAYNMGGWHGAVCVASRTMLNTGRSIWRSMQAEPVLDSLADMGQFWSQMLAENGYETFFTGKWHIQIDPEKLFHHVGHVRPGMPETVPESYNRPLEDQPDPWSPFDNTIGGFWEGGKHWSEVVADDAIDYIQDAARGKDPFFMYIAFNAPHDPRQSPQEYVDMYPVDEIPLPASFQPEYPYKDQIGCSPKLRDEMLAPFPRTAFAVKTHLAEYYAIITHLDHQIGRIISELESQGLADNTYIIYSADHGLSCGEHGLLGKQNMYEHSMKPPLIVVGPGIEANRTSDLLVYLQDIVPTTLELAGVQKSDHVEFNSLWPLILGEDNEGSYPQIYGCYRDLQRMIRDEHFKLILYPKAGVTRLYDLQNDPLELNDLSGVEEYNPRVENMFQQLEELGRSLDDTLVIRDYYLESVGH